MSVPSTSGRRNPIEDAENIPIQTQGGMRDQQVPDYSQLNASMTEVSHEERIRHRANLADKTHLFEEQRKKAEQGLETDISVQDMVNQVKNFDADNIISGKDIVLDGAAVKQFSHVLITKLSQLKDRKVNVINTKLLAQQFRDYIKERDKTKTRGLFEVFGELHRDKLNYAPSFNYMRPAFSIKPPEPKVKKERYKKPVDKSQEKDKEVILKGKTTKQVQEETPEENSLVKQLDLLRKFLKDKVFIEGRDRINYYQFILDPTDYGKSVENMFYMSFLIKDAVVRLEVDPETGLPDIVKVSREERKKYKEKDRSQWNMSQCVVKFTYEHWQMLSQYFQLTEPMIVRD